MMTCAGTTCQKDLCNIIQYPAVQDEIDNSTEPTRFSHHSSLNVQVSYIPACSCFILLHGWHFRSETSFNVCFIVKNMKVKPHKSAVKHHCSRPRNSRLGIKSRLSALCHPIIALDYGISLFLGQSHFGGQPATLRRPLVDVPGV